MAQRVVERRVGIDVSKSTLDIWDWERRHHERIDNTEAAIEQWLNSCETPMQIAVEPTGTFHLTVAQQAHERGHAVYCVDPYRVSHYRESVGQRAKADRTDAWVLARYLCHEQAQLRRWHPLDVRVRQVWQLLTRRAALVKARGQVAQSLRDVSMVRADSEPLMAAFAVTIRRLERRLDALVNELGWRPAVQRCEALPGVGSLNAIALVAAFHRGEFTRADAFIAFLGLDVRVRDSGTFRGKRKLSKRGEPEVRRLLYNAAMAARRSPLWEPYYRALIDRGLSTTAALVALGRKLARVCFALLKHNRTFDPSCCPGG